MNGNAKRNGLAWADLIQRLFIRDLKIAQLWVRERFLPSLRSIDEVARKYRKEQEGSANGVEQESISEFLEEMLAQFDQGFQNLMFVHLFHLFEQQMAQLMSKAGERPGFTFGRSEELLQCAFEIFEFDPTYLESWPQIEELRRIANTVKHYNANDSAKLKNSHPEWFATGAAMRLVRLNTKAFPVEAAMAGMDLYLRPKDYDAKIEAVVNFWEEFAAVLRGEKPKPKSLRDFVFEARERILAIAEKYGASNVRVFGSVARGEAGPASDVDLLVKPGEKMGLFKLIAMENELSELLGRKVDLGTEDGIKPRYKDRILSEAVPL